MPSNRLSLAAALLAVSAGLGARPALADPSLPAPEAMPKPDRAFVFDLGVAAGLAPRYPGSDDFEVRLRPLVGVERLTLPMVGVVAEDPQGGAFVYPAFRLDRARTASDSAELAGLRKVDWGLGLGLGAGINRRKWRAFAEVLAGVKGYGGLTARAGADLIWSPSPKTVAAIGPRVDVSGRDHARTWFGVTPSEAVASGGALSAFSPGGGLAGAGLAARWNQAISDRAMVQVEAGWDRRLGDIADSPLVVQGGRDAGYLSAGVSWRFGFGGD